MPLIFYIFVVGNISTSLKTYDFMVRINDYSIIRKGPTRYEIFFQNNEFCKYASSLLMALYYVNHMIHCVGTGITHFEDMGYKFKFVDHQLYLDF